MLTWTEISQCQSLRHKVVVYEVKWATREEVRRNLWVTSISGTVGERNGGEAGVWNVQ